MAGRRGFKPPGNYDPRRAPAARSSHGGPSRPSSRRNPAEDAASGAPKRQRVPDSAGDRGRQGSDERASGSIEDRLPALSGPLPASLEARRTSSSEVAEATWAQLGFGDNIVRALRDLGADRPLPIQAVTAPDVFAGHHLLGRARTGSGKTIAFGAALVERLLRLKAEGAFPREPARERPKRGERQARPVPHTVRAPKALILAPTRELALQIDRTVQPIARSVGLFTGQFVGGQPFEPQLHALRRGVDIAIGTPGRIEDLARRGHLSLGAVTVTVIDEADHMAELGFIEAVQRILRQTRRGGQRLLFSATLDRGVDGLVREFMPSPAIHEVVDDAVLESGDSSSSADWKPQPNVEHRVLIVLREHKDAAIIQLVRGGGRTVVFCRTRAYAEQISELLGGAGLRALPLHGDLSQARRERNLAKFSEGKADVLVATDVAARGIHVDDIDLVLQADPPDEPKSYVHRAGRTGRVGRAGKVFTLIPRTRQKRMRELFEALGFEPSSFGDFAPHAGS